MQQTYTQRLGEQPKRRHVCFVLPFSLGENRQAGQVVLSSEIRTREAKQRRHPKGSKVVKITCLPVKSGQWAQTSRRGQSAIKVRVKKGPGMGEKSEFQGRDAGARRKRVEARGRVASSCTQRWLLCFCVSAAKGGTTGWLSGQRWDAHGLRLLAQRTREKAEYLRARSGNDT